jgi:hypothetical protein
LIPPREDRQNIPQRHAAAHAVPDLAWQIGQAILRPFEKLLAGMKV